MQHKQDERHVPPVAVQQLVTPASSCTSEGKSHAMMVSSTATAVLEATVADAAHPVPTPRVLRRYHFACTSDLAHSAHASQDSAIPRVTITIALPF